MGHARQLALGVRLLEVQVRPVQRQVAVGPVGRNLVVAPDAVLATGVHPHRGADDVGLREDAGSSMERSHGSLRRSSPGCPALLLEQLIDALTVADVQLHEAGA